MENRGELWRKTSSRQDVKSLFFPTNNIDNIPKKIHQIWINHDFESNNDPKPKLLSFSESMKLQNPDFQYRLWKNQDAEHLFRTHKNLNKYRHFYYNCIATLIERVDFLRLAILYTEGGIYSDMDIQCLKSFDTLIANRKIVLVHDIYHLEWFNTTIMRESSTQPRIFNGFMGFSQEHPLVREMMDFIMHHYDPQNTVFVNTGPFALGNLMSMYDYYDETENPDIYVNRCLIMSKDGFGNLTDECQNYEQDPYADVDFLSGASWQFDATYLYSTVAIKRWVFYLLFFSFLLIVIVFGCYVYSQESYRECKYQVTSCELKQKLNKRN